MVTDEQTGTPFWSGIAKVATIDGLFVSGVFVGAAAGHGSMPQWGVVVAAIVAGVLSNVVYAWCSR